MVGWSRRKGGIAKAREEARKIEKLKQEMADNLKKAGRKVKESIYDQQKEFVEQSRKEDKAVLERNQVGLRDELRRAAKQGDIEKLQESLDKGAWADGPDSVRSFLCVGTDTLTFHLLASAWLHCVDVGCSKRSRELHRITPLREGTL
jgi:hypothetical protein